MRNVMTAVFSLGFPLGMDELYSKSTALFSIKYGKCNAFLLPLFGQLKKEQLIEWGDSGFVRTSRSVVVG